MSVLDRARRGVWPVWQAPIETAVILAAGESSRLRSGDDPTPKPLQELFGLTLVERAILRARAAGVRRFVVVVGYEAAAVTEFLRDLAAELDVTIEAVENATWRRGNGTSVLAAERFIDHAQPFFLVMCDHVFPQAFLERLWQQDAGAGCAVVIDGDVDRVIDLEEATKVAVEGDRVRSIGKSIERFDAVDTGVFLARARLFDGLRAAAAAGEDSLSGGVQWLADRGEVAWVDAAGLHWQDIDTPTDLGVARTKLLRGLSADAEGYVTRALVRRVAAVFTAQLAPRRVRPQVLDGIAFGASLIAAGLFAAGRPSGDRIAGLLVELAAITDPTANAVAQLTYRDTAAFRMTQSLLHRYAETAIAAGIGVGLARRSASRWVWPAVLAAAAGNLLTSYARREGQVRFGDTPPDRVLHVAARRDSRLQALALAGLAGRPELGLYVGGAVGHLDVVWSLVERLRGGAAGPTEARGRG